MIHLLRAGPLTTVQDAGRTAWRDRGISRCGMLDDLALAHANLLVGNAPGAAGLEFTLGTATLRFDAPTCIALCGTDAPGLLDGTPVRPYWRQPVHAGQTLTLAAPRDRMRTVLAVAGGIDTPPALGSRSTDLKAQFGGMGGRALRDGDRLPLGQPGRPTERRLGIAPPAWTPEVRVVPGPEYDEFTPAAHAAFWHTAWRLTPQSNRMGYRFDGPALERCTAHDLPSHGVLPGVIQVPPSGQPIVLLADAQTTGGYPKIGVVIAADLWKLAQLRLGGTLHFRPCTRDDAIAALRQRQRELNQLHTALCMSI
ncbi:biotin-dependent carboxyltransferase family protein [Roseateles sp. BYS87W]|uniref:Biotin-dependent carboxyltransferase family protein n=1 Tax=Pelomonas baiyunensis TaxID=3299026 RepID=A0ABW7GW65_9BURK